MMRPLKPTLAMTLAVILGACATQPAPRGESAADAPGVYAGTCLRETGTRIKLPAGRCVALPGRAYSREELIQTGVPTLPGALSRLNAF